MVRAGLLRTIVFFLLALIIKALEWGAPQSPSEELFSRRCLGFTLSKRFPSFLFVNVEAFLYLLLGEEGWTRTGNSSDEAFLRCSPDRDSVGLQAMRLMSLLLLSEEICMFTVFTQEIACFFSVANQISKLAGQLLPYSSFCNLHWRPHHLEFCSSVPIVSCLLSGGLEGGMEAAFSVFFSLANLAKPYEGIMHG